MFVSPPARANCPDTARATIVFGNGIETTRRDAQASLQSVLEPAISQELGTTVDQSCIAYYLAYDSQFVDLNNKVSSTINFFSQLVDAAVQRDIDFAAHFWQY